MKRPALVACLPLLVVVLAAGCTTSTAGKSVASVNGSPGPAATAQGSFLEQGRRHAQCMRDNGVPEADPQIQPDGGVRVGGGYDKHLLDQDVLARAIEACKQYEPVLSGPDGDRKRASALEFARCMRAHGVEDFPDPDTGGHFSLPTDQTDPDFDQAKAYCQTPHSPNPTATRS